MNLHASSRLHGIDSEVTPASEGPPRYIGQSALAGPESIEATNGIDRDQMSLIDRQKWNRWKNIWLVAPSVPSYYQRCGRLATGADNHWNEHENPLRGCNVGSGRGGCQGFPGAMNVWECGGIFRSAVGLSGRHECRPYTRLFLPALPVGRGVASFSPSLHCHSHSLRCLSRPPHSSFPLPSFVFPAKAGIQRESFNQKEIRFEIAGGYRLKGITRIETLSTLW